MKLCWVSLVVLLFVGQVRSANNKTDHSERSSLVKESASDIVRKVITKGCARKYTMTCFKMDMVDLVDILSEASRYQLFPGVAIVRDKEGTTNRKLPDSLVRSLASDFPYGEDQQLDEYLIGRIGEYLSTHSISLKLMDNSQTDSLEGRGKGIKGQGTLLAGMMMMKGTLMTMGFGALAALAGKALMTGLMSLMLSAIIGMKSHHDGHAHKQTTYEIISKPIYSHSHTHSAEIQHNHDHGHHSAYTYGRNLNYGQGSSGVVTKTSEVEYIQIPAKDEDDFDEKRILDYKTISDEDLKNYYNNLDYAASHNREHKYRKQKSYFEGTTNGDAFQPLTTAAPVLPPN